MFVHACVRVIHPYPLCDRDRFSSKRICPVQNFVIAPTSIYRLPDRLQLASLKYPLACFTVPLMYIRCLSNSSTSGQSLLRMCKKAGSSTNPLCRTRWIHMNEDRNSQKFLTILVFNHLLTLLSPKSSISSLSWLLRRPTPGIITGGRLAKILLETNMISGSCFPDRHVPQKPWYHEIKTSNCLQ